MARLISIVLVGFSVISLTVFYFREWQVGKTRIQKESTDQILQAGTLDETSPDVYYIILDAYGRSDILSDDFDIDNTDFLDSLRSIGFFVADCSQSNYAHTRLSLASSLNYNYLDELGNDFIQGSTDWADLTGLIRNSRVRQFFEGKNYQIIAFETGYAWTEWRNADLFIENEDTFFSKHLSSFETLFLQTTIVAIAMDLEWIPEPQQNVQHYEMILSNLDTLENLADVAGPKFVFAHLVVPHHPFVFDVDGRYRQDRSLSPAFENYTDEEYYNGYRQQVIFINERILDVVETILSNSKRTPIIVIQGDHGPSHAGEEARMSILNAYYLPDKLIENARITPVNSFRVILNSYFDQSLPILPDVSYLSRNTDPYAYTVIPNECIP